MSTFVASVIDEKLYDQTKKDSVAAFAPKNSGLIAGAVAGAVAPWLPALLYFPLGWLYKYTLNAPNFMSSGEKLEYANEWLAGSLGSYASVAIWVTVLLAGYGVLLGLLRRSSALKNKYLSWAMHGRGSFRMGQDAQLTAALVPVASLAGLVAVNRLDVLLIAVVPMFFSGVVYYAYWMRLHDFALKFFYRPSWDVGTSNALRLMIPRTVGWKNAKVENININTSDKSIRVIGEFVSKDVELDARHVVEHYMRGYKPIYVENKLNAAS